MQMVREKTKNCLWNRSARKILLTFDLILKEDSDAFLPKKTTLFWFIFVSQEIFQQARFSVTYFFAWKSWKQIQIKSMLVVKEGCWFLVISFGLTQFEVFLWNNQPDDGSTTLNLLLRMPARDQLGRHRHGYKTERRLNVESAANSEKPPGDDVTMCTRPAHFLVHYLP